MNQDMKDWCFAATIAMWTFLPMFLLVIFSYAWMSATSNEWIARVQP
jgi:hypothetical protein